MLLDVVVLRCFASAGCVIKAIFVQSRHTPSNGCLQWRQMGAPNGRGGLTGTSAARFLFSTVSDNPCKRRLSLRNRYLTTPSGSGVRRWAPLVEKMGAPSETNGSG